MERLHESCCRLAGQVGAVEGGIGELSLWAHMIGSLISAQFCPSNATDQQDQLPTKHRLPFRRRHDEVIFLMDDSTFF